MSLIPCLRCKQQIDEQYDMCPHCGEKITLFQRTYASRLLDGKYQIIDRLGIGGMGEIFKVRHIHLNELRVIKIMRPNIAADDQGLQRFLQEARTSTMIKHKNLAMLYDFAQLDDGSYYMVWEFIDGTNIQKWISQNGPMPPRLTLEIAVQALNGLDHLHSMGLIHRDISPENIMLSQDHHGKLLVKVIDFGIAKQLAEGDAGHGLTQTGMFLGKLKYASPEQAGFLKEGEHLDPRSDLYSFGIVMYEMLAGRAPFQASNPHGYILKHVTEKPAPVAETNPAIAVPPALESIVMRALEKSRDHRYAGAAEFAAALEQIRVSIPPDQKYGLGEKIVTLSGAQTLAELPKFTGTAPQVTASGAQATVQTMGGALPRGTVPGVGPAGTHTGSDEATVVERGVVAPTASGSNDATVVEHLGGTAAPTVAEQKVRFSAAAAEPTVLEPKVQSPAKKNTMLYAALAAVVVIVLGLGAWLVTGRKEAAPGAAVTPASTAAVTATAPAAAAVPIPAGEGVLLLSASPWGDIQRIVSNADGKEVALEEELRSTPARISLRPGEYTVTLVGPGSSETIVVPIQAGVLVEKNVTMGSVDFDALAERAMAEEAEKP